MNSFLEKLCDEILQRYGERLQNICVVFPTRRATLYFKRHLSRKISKPVWSPPVMAVTDFYQSLSGFRNADPLTLLFELFSVYKKSFPEETFDNFYSWGEVMLADFDEMDRNLVDAQKLFAHVRSLKDIDEQFDLDEEYLEYIRNFWKAYFTDDPGLLKKNFLRTWNCLDEIYAEFQIRLSEQNFAYEGKMYKHVAENAAGISAAMEYEQVIFAGFYALSVAEEKFIQHLKFEGKATTFWDADSFYFDDPLQEAGTFLRKSKLIEKRFLWKEDYFSSEKKNIEIIGVSLQVGQAKVAGEMLKEKIGSQLFTPDNTAVVLPDEQLLFPLLNSLPAEVDSLNVTMGIPLASTSVYNLIELLFALQLNIRKTKTGEIKFYHRHVKDIAAHPLIFSAAAGNISKWLKNILSEGEILISKEKFSDALLPEIFKTIFNPQQNPFEYFFSVLKFLLEQLTKENNKTSLEGECVFRFYTQLQRMEEIFKQHEVVTDFELLRNLLKVMSRSVRIPFAGEPLQGLQIMGFLETRCLDFENVILLSVNEDILPASSSGKSFIPFALRKAYKLPTYEEQDAIYAYHFYRLLQRAKNIFLVYNTEVKSISAGEKSRYLLQLEWELKKKFPSTIGITKKLVSVPVEDHQPVEIIIPKDAEVQKAMSRFIFKTPAMPDNVSKLSASGLKTYLSCSLQFYFKYVARLWKPDDTDDFIEAASFGSILHFAMKTLYRKGELMSADMLRQLKKNVEEAVEAGIKKEFPAAAKETEGKNLLLKNVLIELVIRIIDLDIRNAPLLIMHSEEDFSSSLRIGDAQFIKLFGIIDRVDEVNKTIRIIDYKTGTIDPRKPKSLEELFTDPKMNAWFQTMYYAMLFRKKYPSAEMVSGLLPVKKLSQGFQLINDGEKITAEEFDEFEQKLKQVIEEIFNPEIPFTQTEDIDRCIYCDFKNICVR